MIQISKRLMSWASIIDDVTLEQAVTTATMPFIFPHLALMPDAHLGKGATVGSVIPTVGAIIPAAVGVDIGCGMRAVRTQFKKTDLVGGDLAALRMSIERAVPLSAGHHNSTILPSAEGRIAELESLAGEGLSAINAHSSSWTRQLGSLGSGNHFLEVTVDETERVWLFLHSGSRGVGNRIAQHHIDVAKKLAAQWWIALPDPDLAYLVEGTAEFDTYISELTWAQRFAALNRDEMMDRLIDCLQRWIGDEVQVSENINCHHNYSAVEDHFGKRVWVSRKGAIHAGIGVPGLIPGSMGTASYVVEGLGNRLALCSAPHGAGRAFSRAKARKRFTGDDLRAAMTGIEYRDSDAFIDEIPGAYKSIEQVMADAADLVSVVHELRQLVNVKGTDRLSVSNAFMFASPGAWAAGVSMTVQVLDRRSLNRALLARQLLLERSSMSPLQAIEHLVGMQAQLPTPPYYGLWSRLRTFAPDDLSQLFLGREVVRIAMMRSTVHLVSAADALALRAGLQQAIGRGMTPGSPFGKALAGIDLTELSVLGRALVEKGPLTGAEIGIALQKRWPGADVRALAFGLRALVPLVQVPPRGIWGAVGQARCTSAEKWLSGDLAEPDVPAMVRRYLAAYGPASVRDAQAWSGLTGLGRVFESLRPSLLTFRDEAGVELFDLPEAPHPPADLPAPVRFLPDFDAILLSHQVRARMFDPEHKSLIFSSNGIIRSSVLIDGFVTALWSIRCGRDAATLVVTPLPWKGRKIITAPVRRAVAKEGLQLLAFAAPGKSHDVLFDQSAAGDPVRAGQDL